MARYGILNPQPNPQNAMSCTTSAYFVSPRGLVSCGKTYPGKTVTEEVAGSSPVVPANSFKHLQGIGNFPYYLHFLVVLSQQSCVRLTEGEEPNPLLDIRRLYCGSAVSSPKVSGQSGCLPATSASGSLF